MDYKNILNRTGSVDSRYNNRSDYIGYQPELHKNKTNSFTHLNNGLNDFHKLFESNQPIQFKQSNSQLSFLEPNLTGKKTI